MARKYTKRNKAYWNNLKRVDAANNNVLDTTPEAFELSEAYTHLSRTELNDFQTTTYDLRFSNLKRGILPVEYTNGAITMVEPIVLCQKAWANVAMVRNAIEAQVEFSTSKVRIKSKNKTAERLIRAWLKRINIQNLAEQFFRERHRSGNVFMYRIDGVLDENGRKSLETLMKNDVKAAGESIPVKYMMLNPARIAKVGNEWHQILFDNDQLKYSYPKDKWEGITKKAITNQFGKDWNNSKLVKLDKNKLYSYFYQKQDYETFSVPPVWPVLDDIELKMEFKKIDREISRTVENAVIKITHGAKPDDGGISPENHAALKNMFANPSVRRVLVADYTTEVEFVIPDLKKVLGKEKYEIVNEDIKEGLQFILVGDDKFSNMILKAKMFLAKLEKGQDQFLHFLSGEVERVCEALGLKNVPKIEFEKINLKDEVQLQRVLTRLYELGVLTAEETLEAIKSGLLPDPEENVLSQQNFKKLREDDGLYAPSAMVFSQKQDNEQKNEQGRPTGEGTPLESEREQRVMGYNLSEIQDSVSVADDLGDTVKNALMEKYNVEQLNDSQVEFAKTLVNSITTNAPKDMWVESLNEFLVSGEVLKNDRYIQELSSLASEHDIEYYEAAILLNSKN